MCGYFSDPEATEETLSPDGWLDTGDIGYRVGADIVLTGRKKDLIILNGRNIWPLDLEGVAERLPDVKSGDAAAFSVIGPNHDEIAVMVVQCRETDAAKREDLMKGLRGMIREERGIECVIEFVSPHTLPRTSSGKLSRSRARGDFLKRVDWEHVDDSSREQSDSYSGLVDW